MPENQVLPAAAVTIQFAHFISFVRGLNVSRVKNVTQIVQHFYFDWITRAISADVCNTRISWNSPSASSYSLRK